MVARLVAEEGDLKGLVLSFEEGNSWIIGRDPEQCQLVVEDPLTSRRHLIAKMTPNGISVENLSSTNPTQVNEEIVDEPRLLENGDVLKIGSESFRYYMDTNAHVIENEDINNQNNHPPQEEDDTIFDANGVGMPSLADINFGMIETGRWLLKVISGPNAGAEFYMQTGHNYVIGTDPHSCDIVFYDTSVSRQHARIAVSAEDILSIEDLKSRNGVLVNNEKLDGKQHLSPSVIVTTGTTSFVVYDREGEMQTIISPLLPSIVKVLQHDEAVKRSESSTGEAHKGPSQAATEAALPAAPIKRWSWGPVILLAIIIGLFTLGGVATYSLFKTEPVVHVVEENPTQIIDKLLAPFPSVRYSFNSGNGNLLLLGHVSTISDKNQLTYTLEENKFIKNIDDSGLIIDEGVWREINSVLGRNPAWQGISVHSPAAGEFILSGYLHTRKQAESLSDYLSVNFPYLDLLKNQVVVEEDVINQITSWLQQEGIRNVTPKLTNGEISLSGNVPADHEKQFEEIVAKVKDIPGIRTVNDLTVSQSADLGILNISDQYEVSGQSRVGDKFTVLMNGRIISENDVMDGMTVTKITANTIFLEREGIKYRIDYNK